MPAYRVYDDHERALLRLAARGHWAGAAVRWLLTTGCTRADLCRLTWSTIEAIDPTHPMFQEMNEVRWRAARSARRLGRDIALMPVFPNAYGNRMNPGTFRDLLSSLLERGRRMAEDQPERKVDNAFTTYMAKGNRESLA